ncbi:P-loop containing nucleoside triphosphate hydrolase protein [Usnea florida]
MEDAVLTDEGSGTTDHAVPTGMKTGSKELYREDERSPWEDWSPDDIDMDPEETPEAKQYALIVRREKRIGQKSSLILHSITIQSPLIRGVLGVVFDGYKGITTKLKDLTFETPFHEFFYRWDRFQQQIKNENDAVILEHMKLLQDIVSGEIQPHLEKRKELQQNGLITFDYLWALFEPDTVIYKQSDGQDRLFKLVSSGYSKLGETVMFSLTCRYIDCNGDTFGYVTTSLTLNQFDGIKPISELSIMPIKLHSRPNDIWAKLEKRGKCFVGLNGFHYKSYSGLSIISGGFFGNLNKRNIDDGRIIIDSKMWSTYNPDQVPNIEAVDNPPLGIQPSGNILSPWPAPDSMYGENNSYPFVNLAIQAIPHELMSRLNTRPRPQNTQAASILTPHEMALCTPIVRGYCLTSKKWAQFYVENIRDIQWNVDVFQRLVLPPEYKEIIWAFVESQLADDTKFDDIVQGKGQGFIMLLSGEPGVGKTLTAESVAEEMKKPLYSMSAGELGHTAHEVEGQLHKVLELSTKWRAILLIDECDVFLEQRTTSDLERNKLVSVFLRLLEYYKGVMFLTTNRVGTFDNAFQSRIHLTIEYPKLDFRSKMLVWRNFVRPRSDASQFGSNIGETDLKALAKMDMNGREIKNIVKTARLLASQKKMPLAIEHVATVLRVKDGSPVTVKGASRISWLVQLMLQLSRILIRILRELLISLINRLHSKDTPHVRL